MICAGVVDHHVRRVCRCGAGLQILIEERQQHIRDAILPCVGGPCQRSQGAPSRFIWLWNHGPMTR